MTKFLLAFVFSLTAFADTPPPVYKVDPPLVKTGTTFSIPAATTSVNGYLSSSDFTNFNNKSTLPSQTGNSGKYLTTNGTSTSWANVVAGVSSVTASSPLFSSGGSTPNLSCQSATGLLNGCLLSTDWTIFNNKEPAIIPAATSTYFRGDKTFQTLNTSVIGGTLSGDVGGALSSTLIATGAVTDTKASLANKPAITVVSTTNQTLSGLPIIDGFQTVANSLVLLTAQSTGSQNGPWSAQSGAWTRPSWYPSGGTTQAFQFITTLVRLGSTYSGTVWRNTTATPITIDTTATTWVITRITLNSSTSIKATATTDGYLDKNDWTTFNNKLSASAGNYITNPTFEVNTTGWNLYNDSGNPAPATVVDQDITYTSTLSGGSGNGNTVTYIVCGGTYVGPVVTCPSGTAVQVCWYNGPSIAQNPTATVLKAAFDAQACATAIATATITGTASNRQYITGTATLANGGDTSPVDGSGGIVSGITFTQNTSTPLVGTASGDLGKSAANEQGQGVSTDFSINSVDQNQRLQISFVYSGSSGMVLGTSSDARVFVYDVGNSVLIPVSPLKTLAGPVSTAKTFVGTFQASSSANYRLIIHNSTTSATAWDLLTDSVVINDSINATAATQVPSVVLTLQPISGAVTDHMVVMWRDSATSWVPATIAGVTVSVFGTDFTQLGFATNIVGSTADIYVSGYMGGFGFGPFVGYEQYIDNTAGLISPLPSPFTDSYVAVGMAISSTELNIQFNPKAPLIQTSNVPRKGGILTNTGANDGTGDVAIAGGTTGQFLRANSAITNGLQWFTPVGTAPIVYTAATSAYSCTVATGSVAGCLAAADFTTFNAKAATASPTFTGTPTLPTGTIAVTQTAGNSTTAIATTAFVTTADNLKANLASPTFTGTPTLPTGTIGVTQTAGNSTTALATTAFVTTADNLKAPLASPTFTGDVNVSTGNLLISTIGKGEQIKTGTNAKIGTAVLVGGAVTVANTSVTANSRIFVTSNTDGGTPGFLRVSAKTNGTSFVITSSNPLDTSTVAWVIIESIP